VNVRNNSEYDLSKNGFLKKVGFYTSINFFDPYSQIEIIKYVSENKTVNTFYDCGITNTVLKNTIYNIVINYNDLYKKVNTILHYVKIWLDSHMSMLNISKAKYYAF